MKKELDPLVAEQEFFDALIAGKVEVVMRGGEITKPGLLAAVASGQAKFESIKPSERRVRSFGSTAIVTGRTEMRGRFGESAFAVRSRYTHVYVEQQGRLRLASAQGTQIVEM